MGLLTIQKNGTVSGKSPNGLISLINTNQTLKKKMGQSFLCNSPPPPSSKKIVIIVVKYIVQKQLRNKLPWIYREESNAFSLKKYLSSLKINRRPTCLHCPATKSLGHWDLKNDED